MLTGKAAKQAATRANPTRGRAGSEGYVVGGGYHRQFLREAKALAKKLAKEEDGPITVEDKLTGRTVDVVYP